MVAGGFSPFSPSLALLLPARFLDVPTAAQGLVQGHELGTGGGPGLGEIDLGGFDFGDAPAAAAAPTGIDTTDFSNFTAAAPTSAGAESSFSFDEAAF